MSKRNLRKNSKNHHNDDAWLQKRRNVSKLICRGFLRQSILCMNTYLTSKPLVALGISQRVHLHFKIRAKENPDYRCASSQDYYTCSLMMIKVSDLVHSDYRRWNEELLKTLDVSEDIQ
ncbi:hypothetical protein YC2023_089057 [Brassica napus]